MLVVPMRPKMVHWFGGLRWTNARNITTHMLRGWPACCSGEKAERLDAMGPEVRAARVEAVTCKACLQLLARPGAETGNALTVAR